MPSHGENDDSFLLILEREPNHILDLGENSWTSPEQFVHQACTAELLQEFRQQAESTELNVILSGIRVL